MAKLTEDQWQEIQAMWCVGKRTNREIGEKFGISHVAIQKRAKRDNWQKADEVIVNEAIETESKAQEAMRKLKELPEVTNLGNYVVTEVSDHASIRSNVDFVGATLSGISVDFVIEMAKKAKTSKIESVDDMKPFMAMTQLINEMMKNPMKIVELETKQPESKETEAEPLSITFDVASAVGEVKITRHNEQS